MKMIDPTYLRTIHDGLLSGAVHKENASALPQGLVGMYEEALPPAINVSERKKFLEFFSIWALLKKEVSAEFVLPLLKGLTEEQVIDYIAQYSKWFNSPVSGKYVLYHERLRTFILQKVSAHHFEKSNEQIIHQCQIALQAKAGDEWERYALEYLSVHLLIQAIESNDGEDLKTLSYNTAHWNRQVEISKAYTWTKKGLLSVLTWALKHDNNEVVECGLQLLDMHYQEQNSAPEIVALVAEGDIETALKRIESFGGINQDGIQRKFILYMQCLMELTLLDNKTKPHRKLGIAKLLNHLEEQLPFDHSVLDWNDFFSSYIIFQMACEWAELGLDYLIVYKRTMDWESNWIVTMGPYSSLQFIVLKACVCEISSEFERSRGLAAISEVLAKQGKVEEALICALDISSNIEKCRALSAISSEQFKRGQAEEASSTMQEAYAFARGINSYWGNSRALIFISAELTEQGRAEEALSAILEAHTFTSYITDELDKNRSQLAISLELVKLNQVELAFNCARGIIDDYWKIQALIVISTKLWELDMSQESYSTMQEALVCIGRLNSGVEKIYAHVALSKELAKQGQLEDALSCAFGISSIREKSSLLVVIATELAKKGQIEKSFFVLEEALKCIRDISSDREMSRALVAIFTELTELGKVVEITETIEEVLNYALGIKAESEKFSALVSISTEFAKKGLGLKVSSLLNEALVGVIGKSDDNWKIHVLFSILKELAEKGEIEKALIFARGLKNDFWITRAFVQISAELSLKGFSEEAYFVIQEAQKIAYGISDYYLQSLTLAQISTELAMLGHTDDAFLAYLEAVKCAKNISVEREKSGALVAISSELAKQSNSEEASLNIQEAFICTRGISSIGEKIYSLVEISSELAKQGRIEEAFFAMQEAFTCARSISDDYWKSHALVAISNELAKQGQLDQAITCTDNISDDYWKSHALVAISKKLTELGKVEEALACARGISDFNWKSQALVTISTELFKQDRVEIAEAIGFEIPQIAKRYNCWKASGKVSVEIHDWLMALRGVQHYKSEEPRLFYLKGWSEQVDVIDVTAECVAAALPNLANDIESIENLLQKYALRVILVGCSEKDLQQRLNRTLNIQWAIDIKNKI